jgi:hypothetical protein
MCHQERDTWLRARAIELAAELPEDRQQALAVLDCAREIVAEQFMAGHPERRLGPVSVVRLLAGQD